MTTGELRRLAVAAIEYIGVEPLSPEEIAEVGALRSRLEAIALGEQPMPTPTVGRPVWELVIEDMRSRDQLGRQRYGTPLQANNGRDALQDAYEEALDLAVYLRQAIAERDA